MSQHGSDSESVTRYTLHYSYSGSSRLYAIVHGERLEVPHAMWEYLYIDWPDAQIQVGRDQVWVHMHVPYSPRSLDREE